jgi:rhodanese-related sulfurtransferase
MEIKVKKFDDLMKISNEITSISVDEAKEKLNDPNVQFIDVRDKNSYEAETIGNAVNLERGLLEFYLADGSPLENEMFKNNPDKEYVVFCGLGGQSTLATKTMQDMGLKNVKNLTGGMTSWKEKK